MSNIKKMLVTGRSLFFTTGTQIMYFDLIENNGSISIDRKAILENKKMLAFSLSDICIWNVFDSNVFINFVAVKTNNQVLDLIVPEVISGDLVLKQNMNVPNIGGATCFVSIAETQSLVTANFQGLISFWNMIEVESEYEMMQMTKLEFENHRFNFMDRTSGKNTLILGTQDGDVMVVNHLHQFMLLKFNFGNIIHYIIEEKNDQNEVFLRVVGPDPTNLFKKEIDHGICQMIYDFQPLEEKRSPPKQETPKQETPKQETPKQETPEKETQKSENNSESESDSDTDTDTDTKESEDKNEEKRLQKELE